MGNSRFDYTSYAARSASTTLRSDGTVKSAQEVFHQRHIHESLDPKNIVLRESRDSEANPNSTPVIIGLDVTGSMGHIAVEFANNLIGKVMSDIYEQGIVSDPHLMFMGIGDTTCDRAPLQASQFEADIRISTELEKLYVERGGGGNEFESYTMPWYFANNFTSTDAWEKRQKKGYLFTIGDEQIPPDISANDVQKVFGKPQTQGFRIDTKDLFAETSKKWEIFHIIVEQGNYASSRLRETVNSWHNVIGNRTLRLDNYRYLGDVILSAMRVSEGQDPEAVINAVRQEAQSTVRKALYLSGEFAQQAA